MLLMFTEMEAINPTYLAKTFTLQPDGTVARQTDGYLTHGIATVKQMSMEALLPYLHDLTPNYVVTYGTPEYEQALVLSSKIRESWTKEADDLPVIGRDNAHFHLNSGPGILMLDHDLLEGQEPFTQEQLLTALYGVCPAFESAPHIWAPSASSCIYYPDGTEYRELTSQRVLFTIEKGSDVPRLLRILNIKLWLNGFGFIRVSSSGTQLVRSIIDTCTGQPSRIDFIGGAHCLGGLVQKRKELITGFNLNAPFLKREDYPKLTPKERREYENLVNLAKRRSAREARRKRAIWVRERVEAQLAKYPEGEREARREELMRIYGTAECVNNFETPFQ
jgi:hypothetical protein